MQDWIELGSKKEYAQGEILWHQDDPPGIGVFLVDGILGVERVTERGERIVFTRLNRGSLLGEMSSLDGKAHSATVVALSQTHVRVFKSEELKRFIKEEPNRLLWLLKRQNERIRYLSDKITQIGTEPVWRRLVYWLCQQTNTTITITHQDLAAELATTRESISKALASLRRKKYLKSGRGFVTLSDKEALASLLQ